MNKLLVAKLMDLETRLYAAESQNRRIQQKLQMISPAAMGVGLPSNQPVRKIRTFSLSVGWQIPSTGGTPTYDDTSVRMTDGHVLSGGVEYTLGSGQTNEITKVDGFFPFTPQSGVLEYVFVLVNHDDSTYHVIGQATSWTGYTPTGYIADYDIVPIAAFKFTETNYAFDPKNTQIYHEGDIVLGRGIASDFPYKRFRVDITESGYSVFVNAGIWETCGHRYSVPDTTVDGPGSSELGVGFAAAFPGVGDYVVYLEKVAPEYGDRGIQPDDVAVVCAAAPFTDDTDMRQYKWLLASFTIIEGGFVDPDSLVWHWIGDIDEVVPTPDGSLFPGLADKLQTLEFRDESLYELQMFDADTTTLYAPGETWEGKYGIPALPKGANNTGDLKWIGLDSEQSHNQKTLEIEATKGLQLYGADNTDLDIPGGAWPTYGIPMLKSSEAGKILTWVGLDSDADDEQKSLEVDDSYGLQIYKMDTADEPFTVVIDFVETSTVGALEGFCMRTKPSGEVIWRSLDLMIDYIGEQFESRNILTDHDLEFHSDYNDLALTGKAVGKVPAVVTVEGVGERWEWKYLYEIGEIGTTLDDRYWRRNALDFTGSDGDYTTSGVLTANGGLVADKGSAASAGRFTDGANQVDICDGTLGIACDGDLEVVNAHNIKVATGSYWNNGKQGGTDDISGNYVSGGIVLGAPTVKTWGDLDPTDKVLVWTS